MALKLIRAQTLWKRTVAQGATAIMAGGGNDNRNQFIPGSDPDTGSGTFSQGTSQAGSILMASLMNINVGTEATDRLFIAGTFKPTAVSGTQSLTITKSRIQAVAFGASKNGRGGLWSDLAIVANNIEVPEADRQIHFGQQLYPLCNDQGMSAPKMGAATGNPPDVVLAGGFFYAPTAAGITVANAIGKQVQWEFELTRRNSGAVLGASEASAFPIMPPNVRGLGIIRLCLSMVNAATAAFADGTTATLDGEVLALHFKEV